MAAAPPGTQLVPCHRSGVKEPSPRWPSDPGHRAVSSPRSPPLTGSRRNGAVVGFFQVILYSLDVARLKNLRTGEAFPLASRTVVGRSPACVIRLASPL